MQSVCGSLLYEARVVVDAHGAAAGRGSKIEHTAALSAAIVKKPVLPGQIAAAGKALEHAVVGWLVCVADGIGQEIFAAAGVDVQFPVIPKIRLHDLVNFLCRLGFYDFYN